MLGAQGQLETPVTPEHGAELASEIGANCRMLPGLGCLERVKGWAEFGHLG
jgi:hypothetical protein